MSFEAAAWAMRQETERSLEKLILVILADCHNDETGRCDPSIEYLSQRSICKKRAAINAISNLEKQGYLTTIKSAGIRTKYTLKVVHERHQCIKDTSASKVQSGARKAKSGARKVPQTKKNQEVTKNKESNIELPSFVDKELWEGFLDIRKDLKAKNSPLAITKLINKLTQFKDQNIDPNIALENSIMNSWKSLYLPKDFKHPAEGNHPTKHISEISL